MPERLKQCSLVLCLFVFLFVIIGNGFHLKPGGAFIAALSGTPLVIYAFNRWAGAAFQREHVRHIVSSGGNPRETPISAHNRARSPEHDNRDLAERT